MKRERVFKYVNNTSTPNMTTMTTMRYNICEDIPSTSDTEYNKNMIKIDIISSI